MPWQVSGPGEDTSGSLVYTPERVRINGVVVVLNGFKLFQLFGEHLVVLDDQEGLTISAYFGELEGLLAWVKLDLVESYLYIHGF